jgi:OOP family OmpA-OmpF porin
MMLALGVWWLFKVREQGRFDAYLERLSAEPGIVLLASGERDGAFFVSGLRDPLARDPAEFIAGAGLAPDSVRGRWEPYQALHPPFVSARAAFLLRPPAGVALTYDQGVLTATGAAPQGWVDDTLRLAPAIAGVREFRFLGESAELRLAAAIERASVHFGKASSEIGATEEANLAALLTQLRELNDALAASRRRARLDVLGYADSDGPDDVNSQLSQARADRVRARLAQAGLSHIDLVARGLGRAPARLGATEAEHQQNRRTSFRVHFTDDPSSRSTPQ